jgi:hypothetical protein
MQGGDSTRDVGKLRFHGQPSLQMAFDAGCAMEHYRLLDCERIEDVIQCWMQVALGDPSRDSEDDFDLRLKASYAVPEGIGMRQKITLASRPQRRMLLR